MSGNQNPNQSKILTIDIETKPGKAYVWGLFDQNIGLSQLIEPSAPICFSAKWLGSKEVFFHADWIDGHEGMIAAAHGLISEADAVVGYNSDGFDLKKLNGEYLLCGLTLPPPVTSIDLLKTVKKLGFQSNKLAYIGPLLNIGSKVANEGFDLWRKVDEGDVAAQKRMQKYNVGDVRLTEQLYLTLRPFIVNHPHLGEVGSTACGACGSHRLHKRGPRRTKTYLIQRLQCQDCGAWQSGERKKI